MQNKRVSATVTWWSTIPWNSFKSCAGNQAFSLSSMINTPNALHRKSNERNHFEIQKLQMYGNIYLLNIPYKSFNVFTIRFVRKCSNVKKTAVLSSKCIIRFPTIFLNKLLLIKPTMKTYKNIRDCISENTILRPRMHFNNYM